MEYGKKINQDCKGREEYWKQSAELFAAADANNDGKLDPDEFKVYTKSTYEKFVVPMMKDACNNCEECKNKVGEEEGEKCENCKKM